MGGVGYEPDRLAPAVDVEVTPLDEFGEVARCARIRHKALAHVGKRLVVGPVAAVVLGYRAVLRLHTAAVLDKVLGVGVKLVAAGHAVQPRLVAEPLLVESEPGPFRGDCGDALRRGSTPLGRVEVWLAHTILRLAAAAVHH